MQEGTESITKKVLVAYVNHGFTLLFAYLTQKGLRADGVLTPENILILATGAVSGGLSLGMVIYRKLKARRLVEAARVAPAGVSLEVIKSDAAAMPLIPSTPTYPEVQ
jgi:hypothetical protein